MTKTFDWLATNLKSDDIHQKHVIVIDVLSRRHNGILIVKDSDGGKIKVGAEWNNTSLIGRVTNPTSLGLTQEELDNFAIYGELTKVYIPNDN